MNDKQFEKYVFAVAETLAGLFLCSTRACFPYLAEADASEEAQVDLEAILARTGIPKGDHR